MIEAIAQVPPAYLALVGAVFGGVGLKALEHYLTRPKIKEDAASEFRRELREEITTLRTELRRTEEDLEQWRTKYYVLRELQIQLKEETSRITHPE